jgi:DNA/RNA endonuclease YhcR with UshA esterase domain
MKYLRLLFFLSLISFFSFAQDHLLITEIVVTPTEGEFVEIHNPTNNVIDLSDYYLTDATFAGGGAYYYNIVTGQNAGGGGFGDFHARFPESASIGPGEFQTIAMNGTNFTATYGNPPTYELWDTDAGITDMREALPGLINNQGGLTNSGEMVILYHWDGQSDLVDDVDYLVYGDKEEAVDKTGVSIDGPDPGTDPSTYLDDTAIPQQISASPGQPHDIGESIQRLTLTENGETQSGGNGITGHDETSEDLVSSFPVGAPNPGSGPGGGGGPTISNVTIDPASPTASDEVTVSASVTDDDMVISVKLFYSVSSGPADSTDMAAVGGDTYQGIIPPQPEGSVVQYSIKAEDNEGNISNSPNFSYNIAGVTPIAAIQANPSAFNVVTIQGIVTLGAGVTITTRTDAYVQDGSGRGINIFSFDAPDPLLVRGNEVRITGTVEEFQGVTEITNYTAELISTGNPIPDHLELSTQQANNTDLEGTYTGVKGVITGIGAAGGGTTINLDDGSGEVLVRVWDVTGIDLSGLNEGDSLEVTAVMDIFQDASQLVPGYQDEIGTQGVQPGDGSGTATISPDSVGVSETVTETLTITGTADYVLESVSVTVPADWQWVSLPANVQISGSGFSGASVTVQGKVITIRSAAVTDLNQGVVEISALTSPSFGLVSQFMVRTASAGGNLTAIAISPAVKVGEGAPVGVTPIAQIKNNLPAFLGKEVTVEGIITLGAGITNTGRVDAYIQDGSGRGINLFSFDPPTPADGIDRGNRLRVSGLIEEFNGVVEITTFSSQLISTGNPVPEPLFVSTVIANDLMLEGTYIKVVGVADDIETNVGGGTNITLRDDKGSVLIRVWNTTEINLGFLQAGDTISVQGVMDIFNNASQLIPGYQDEIIVPGKTARADGSGIAIASPEVVAASDTLQTFSISIIGVLEEPIKTIRIDIPKLWQWSGNEADISFSGSSLENIIPEAVLDPLDSVYQVYLIDSDIALEDTAVITFRNLVTPAEPLNSVFWIRTAGNGGRLTMINEIPIVNVAGGTRYLVYDLQTSSSHFSGTVEVRGVSTIGAGLLREVSSTGDSLTTAYIQDESGRGVNLFRFGLIQPELQRGNLVMVRGTVTEFNGVTEIEYTDISLLAAGVELPQPFSLSNAEVNSNRWDGTLVATAGVILEKFSAGGGTTLEIGDGKGQTNVRVWDTARLDLSGINVNDRIFVEGVGSLFIDDGDSIFQILPAYQDQIELDPNYAPQLTSVALRVDPHPFAPDQGERIAITYSAAAVNNTITVRIFDLGGRLITTLLDEQAQTIENTFRWDGRDRLNERVPLGTYICLLEVIEPVSGKKITKTAPIVVGTILSR